jgi:AcrR family transcriptional regulator
MCPVPPFGATNPRDPKDHKALPTPAQPSTFGTSSRPARSPAADEIADAASQERGQGVTKTRRTEGVRTQGRAARVVDGVLRAAAEELSRAGYAALRVEDVAQRSGVNKTTIYRRWPTKAALVTAAITRLIQAQMLPDTGSLRQDTLDILLEFVRLSSTPLGLGIIRTLQVERAHPDVEPIARKLRQYNRAARIGLVERAIARGQLPAGTNPELVVDLLFSPIISRIVTHGEIADEQYVRAAVDVVLAGLGTGAAVLER